MEWDLVIGLEVHVQLKTKSKLFSGASTTFGAPANSQTCFIDAGLPGVLPVLNKEVVTMAIKLGLALRADINDGSYFERKNYFYPDLPKGYQISQLQQPIVSNGSLAITLSDNSIKNVLIERAHIEEDAGKSLHNSHAFCTGIDLNRAGTALIEIVTTPCLYSIEETIAYLKTLHQLVRFLGICDGNMQEGSFRCDINLSLKPKGSTILGTRTELKNLNSFRNIEKAIAYEQARHQDLLEQGIAIIQETRLFNPDTNTTHAMRSKENENDYRYFPDPDLLPIHITRMQIAEIKRSMNELPEQIKIKLEQLPDLRHEDISFILSAPEIYAFYQEIKKESLCTDKLIINWLKGPYAAGLNECNKFFDTHPISVKNMTTLLNKIEDKTLSTHSAKHVFETLWQGEEDIEGIIQRNAQESNLEPLELLIKDLIHNYPEQAAQYRAGKNKLLAFFVGHIMKQTKGKADPACINRLLKEYLTHS